MHLVSVLRRAAILIALFAALAAIASSTVFHEALLDALLAIDQIIDEHVVLGAVAFVGLAAVSAMIAFVSVAIAVPAAVFAWGTPATAGLLWLGWILGGITTYCIGRFLGRPVVRCLAADEGLRRLEREIPPNAPLWLIVLLQLALPSEIPGYVLGLLRFPFSRCVLAVAIAELPYALATVYLGAKFVQGRGALILSSGALIAVFGVVAFWGLRTALTRRERQDSRSSEQGSAEQARLCS
jgi:uncharacterized membrane protein YdjX (TVP38/TMEM64 family)